MKTAKMRGLTVSSALLFIGMGCSHHGIDPQEQEDVVLGAHVHQVVGASNAFGLNLFREMCGSETTSVFVSPLSVSMALGMTLNGAAEETERDMRATLGFTGMGTNSINESYRKLSEYLLYADSKTQFELANSIWYRKDFTVLQSFIDVNRTFFDAVVEGLDFNDPAAAGTINGWVAANTHGRIKEIIDDPIDADAIMYLINSCYFKGVWTILFDTNNSRSGTFTLTNSTVKQPVFMHRTGSFAYYADNDLQAVDLPYGNGKFSMTILLPAQGKSVNDIVPSLTPEKWSNLTDKLAKDTVILSLPRFKFEYKTELSKILTALGMGVAFTGTADFSRINGTGGLCISRVLHKTFVEVNETGTEAAAVTAVEIRYTSAPVDPVAKTMTVDRPFVFAIRENTTGTIVFIGRIDDPTAGKN